MRTEKIKRLLKYRPKEDCIFKLWFELCSLERKIRELDINRITKFLRYAEQIEYISKEINRKSRYEKEMIIEDIEAARKYLIDNNAFEEVSFADEKREYFESKFMKRDDREIKG